MKLLKFHVLRHLIDDIERFGCPQNYNGGPCEANFKPQKHMAKLTQNVNTHSTTNLHNAYQSIIVLTEQSMNPVHGIEP